MLKAQAERWRLRAAGPADAAALLAPLCAEHAAYEGSAWAPDPAFAPRLARALAERRLRAWLLLIGRGEELQALGYASLTIDFATWSARPYAHLDCLYLRPAARGRGLGARLLARAKRGAAEAGCSELQWQTPAWNEDARRFYLREGARSLDKTRFILPLAGASHAAPVLPADLEQR